jgi:hypothetical protein
VKIAIIFKSHQKNGVATNEQKVFISDVTIPQRDFYTVQEETAIADGSFFANGSFLKMWTLFRLLCQGGHMSL